MPLEPLFGSFRPLIDRHFEAAKSDGGSRVAAVTLLIEEEPLGKGKERAEFMSMDSGDSIRVTWNAIASLWALSHGVARLSRRMFDANRERVERLSINDDPEIVRGLDSLELARRFRTEDVPAAAASADRWPSWAPRIDAAPVPESDDANGVRFFLGALDWILRHELAHIALNHAEREKAGGMTYTACEIEADIEAARWLKGSLRSDPQRALSGRPAKDELSLEWRGVSMGVGIVWIALFEAGLAAKNDKYPPVAERLVKCLDVLGLREDSGAAEILSHSIKAWIGPEENWAPPGGHPTAQDALNEAAFRLHRHLNT